MDKVAVLNLRPMQTGKIAKRYDSDEEFIQTELTLKAVQLGLGVIADLTTG
jgi:hypothetical protein